MRIESSILASLTELREIEQQRIADERAAIEHARAVEIEVKRAAEQARIDAERARVRTEREELLRIEQARVDAEREARMRVEASHAAEHARLHAALEQQRMQEEMELRRAEVLQRRPRWMVAVTALAVAATVALAWIAIDRAHVTERAETAKQNALEQARIAKQDQEEARGELAKLEQQLSALDDQIQHAEQRLGISQTDADRKRLAAEIVEANRQKSEARNRLAAAKAAAIKAEQGSGFQFRAGCTDTPLGCINRPKSK